MREFIFTCLILFCSSRVSAQTGDWQILKDARNICRMAVPRDWSPYGETQSAAIFHDSATAMAVVTSQPGQEFHPLAENLIRALNISADKLFENSAGRVFYQDRVSKGPADPNSYSFSVPAKGGTCSGHLTFLPGVGAEIARKIALSLSPVAAPVPGSN